MTNKLQDTETSRNWSLATEEELAQGYRDMAADKEREAEALEWCEALIGDGFETR